MFSYDKDIYKKIMRPLGLCYSVNSNEKKNIKSFVPRNQEEYWRFLYPQTILDIMSVTRPETYSTISSGKFDNRYIPISTVDNLKIALKGDNPYLKDIYNHLRDIVKQSVAIDIMQHNDAKTSNLLTADRQIIEDFCNNNSMIIAEKTEEKNNELIKVLMDLHDEVVSDKRFDSDFILFIDRKIKDNPIGVISILLCFALFSEGEEDGVFIDDLKRQYYILLDEDKENNKKAISVIREGMRVYCRSIGSRYINDSTSLELIPYVSDFESWLGRAASIELKESLELLWKQKNWNSLYIGKSGFGKTTACFLIIKEFIENRQDVLPIYVDASKCIHYVGDEIIVQYIKETYIDQFHLKLSANEIYELLFGEQKDEKGNKPRIIIFIDGVSLCNGQDCDILQKEFDRLRLNNAVQTVLLANSMVLPIVIGEIAVQRFDFQELSNEQIKSYLVNMGIQKCTVSYDILSNPLILTIYAKTNDYLGKYTGNTTHYMRKEIQSGSDVLWNMLEMFAIRFSDGKKSDIDQLRMVYAVRFLMPAIAWYMEKTGKKYFTLRDFSKYMEDFQGLFVEELYSDVYDEFFGYENELCLSINEMRTVLEDLFVSRAGLLEKSNGRYFFHSEELKHFLTATFVYRYLLVKNIKRERAYELEHILLTTDTCRFIGELTGEINNALTETKDGYVVNNVNTEIQKMLSIYRYKVDDLAKNAISNLVLIMKVARKNILAGLDLSYLDLRRNTFSHVVLSVPGVDGVIATKFDNAILDQWCFMTPGYCQDNCKIRILGDNIFSTDSKGNIVCFSLTEKVMRTLWTGNDIIQDFDIGDDEMIVSEMKNGVFMIDFSGNIKKNLSGEVVKETTLFHKTKFLDKKMYSFITRTKKLYILDQNNETRIIDANAMDYSCWGESIFVATRGREIREYNNELNQMVMSYHYDNIADSYLSKIAIYKMNIYASTKNGRIIRWNIGEDVATLVTDLREEITDFVIREDVFYVVTDNGSLYKVKEDGVFDVLYSGSYRWRAMDIAQDIIAMTSIDGAIMIFDYKDCSFEIIMDKSKEYAIPYLKIEGCTFIGVDTTYLSEQFIKDMKALGAVF